jgi:hypothetical protein
VRSIGGSFRVGAPGRRRRREFFTAGDAPAECALGAVAAEAVERAGRVRPHLRDDVGVRAAGQHGDRRGGDAQLLGLFGDPLGGDAARGAHFQVVVVHQVAELEQPVKRREDQDPGAGARGDRLGGGAAAGRVRAGVLAAGRDQARGLTGATGDDDDRRRLGLGDREGKRRGGRGLTLGGFLGGPALTLGAARVDHRVADAGRQGLAGLLGERLPAGLAIAVVRVAVAGVLAAGDIGAAAAAAVRLAVAALVRLAALGGDQVDAAQRDGGQPPHRDVHRQRRGLAVLAVPKLRPGQHDHRVRRQRATLRQRAPRRQADVPAADRCRPGWRRRQGDHAGVGHPADLFAGGRVEHPRGAGRHRAGGELGPAGGPLGGDPGLVRGGRGGAAGGELGRVDLLGLRGALPVCPAGEGCGHRGLRVSRLGARCPAGQDPPYRPN